MLTEFQCLPFQPLATLVSVCRQRFPGKSSGLPPAALTSPATQRNTAAVRRPALVSLPLVPPTGHGQSSRMYPVLLSSLKPRSVRASSLLWPPYRIALFLTTLLLYSFSTVAYFCKRYIWQAMVAFIYAQNNLYPRFIYSFVISLGSTSSLLWE